MGYGTNLANAIAAKGWSVAETSRRSGVNSNTIHTTIRRDSSVRFDHALRLSSVLGIEIHLICKENPYEQSDAAIDSDRNSDGTFSGLSENSFDRTRITRILDLYSYSDYPELEQLLSTFYILDEEGRHQIFDMLEVQKRRHIDPEHTKKYKML